MIDLTKPEGNPQVPRSDIVDDFASKHEFVMGEVYGLRSWNVDELGRLRGVHYRHPVRPGENIARCGDHMDSYPIDKKHDMTNCSCGFYAYFADEEHPRAYGSVFGVIRAYGRTTIGTSGFRAEKMNVVALAVTANKTYLDRNPLEKFLGLLYPRRNVMLGSDLFPTLLYIAAAICGIFPMIIGWLDYFWPDGNGGEPTFGWTIALTVLVGYALFGLFNADAHFLRPSKKQLRKRTEAFNSANEKIERFKKLYPGVPIYSSRKEMLKNHPISSIEDFVSGSVVPDPDTDPDFWERDL